MVKRKEREAALEILRISTLLALPLSFICTFLLFVTPCLFRDKICNPAPFFSAYAWGFAVGYLISDKILHMSDWILDESKRPDLAEGRKGVTFALVSIVVGYMIGIIESLLYVHIMSISYTPYDIIRGWSVIIGGAGFCGFLGGGMFKIKKIVSYANY